MGYPFSVGVKSIRSVRIEAESKVLCERKRPKSPLLIPFDLKLKVIVTLRFKIIFRSCAQILCE
jgi:hypothetical protein